TPRPKCLLFSIAKTCESCAPTATAWCASSSAANGACRRSRRESTPARSPLSPERHYTPLRMRTIVAILGATATGKSALALRLAEHLDGEIVNADALQVYRGFDVGTGKPTAADRARVPHHLLDILDPDEPLSAGELARRARIAIAEVQ